MTKPLTRVPYYENETITDKQYARRLIYKYGVYNAINYAELEPEIYRNIKDDQKLIDRINKHIVLESRRVIKIFDL